MQQHGEVVEDVGGLVGDALVGLLAGGAGDLLGLLLDLLADERRVGEQLGACRSPRRALARGLASVRSRPGSASYGAAGSSVAGVEAGALARVAGRAGGLDEGEHARRRRSRSAVALTACAFPEVAPLCQSSSRRAAEQVQLAGLAAERASASSFM